MKIWLKLLIGSLIGILLAFFLPDTWTNIKILEYVSRIAINIGRYILFPLVFFSVVTGIHFLVQKRRVMGVFSRTIIYMIITSAVMAIFGTLSVLLISPERIPVIIQESTKTELPDIFKTLFDIFPRNFFATFFQDGNKILPIYVMAVLIGFNMNFDKVITRSATQLLESFTGIFRHINSFILELSGFFIIPIAWYITEQIINTPEIELFREMLLVLIADVLIVILIIYPIVIYFATGKKNPYKIIFSVLTPSIAALVSGDILFCLSVQMKDSIKKTSNREAPSVSLPLLAIFSKAGTAMITGAAFIVILKSYSSLGLTASGIVWVSVFAFLSSFVVGSFPGTGVLVSISLLCSIYGKGIEEGYLLLKPVLPILYSISALLDTMTNSIISSTVSKLSDIKETTKIEK